MVSFVSDVHDDFNLSEKSRKITNKLYVYKHQDVKEFIRRLKEEIGGLVGINEVINKLAGDKLK